MRPTVAAYINRGNVLRELKRTEEALESYDRAIALNPHYAEVYNNRGSALQELGRFDEAAASYQRAIGLKPEYAEPHSNLGVVLTKLRRLDEAMAAFDRAIALKEDYAEAIWNRGLARLLIGHYSSGWRDYEARKRKKAPVGDRTYASRSGLAMPPSAARLSWCIGSRGLGIRFSSAVMSSYSQTPAPGSFRAAASAEEADGVARPQGANRRHRRAAAWLRFPLPPDESAARVWDRISDDARPRPLPPCRRREGERLARAPWPEGKAIYRVAWSGRSEPDRTRSIDLRQFGALFDERYQFISLQKDVSEEDRP